MKQINIHPILFSLLSLTVMFSSCEKEISLDFHKIESNYVIDGDVTPQQIKVQISQTQDVLATNNPQPFTEAKVQIIQTNGDQQQIIPLSADADGIFRPLSPVTGTIGSSYELQTTLKEETYLASSHLYNLGSLTEPYFEWTKVNSSLDMLFLRFTFMDIPNENNFYYIKVYRNSRLFGEQYLNDKEKDGKNIQADLFCTTNTLMDDADYEENKYDESYLFNKDTLIIHISSLDKDAYDYLESVRTATNNGGDPYKMFVKESDLKEAPNILGYFSAYTEQIDTLIYYEDQIKKP